MVSGNRRVAVQLCFSNHTSDHVYFRYNYLTVNLRWHHVSLSLDCRDACGTMLSDPFMNPQQVPEIRVVLLSLMYLCPVPTIQSSIRNTVGNSIGKTLSLPCLVLCVMFCIHIPDDLD